MFSFKNKSFNNFLQVQMLLARHRKSVFGKGFIGELGSENLATHRNSTLNFREIPMFSFYNFS